MIPVRPDRPRHESGGFARGRAEAAHVLAVRRARATRTVADNCHDAADRDHLLSVLGLAEPPTEERKADDDTRALARALQTYVHAVADAVGVPHDATMCEVTDTVTAYLALSRRRHETPEQDLMLVWSEGQGWAVAVETAPTEPPMLVSRLGEDPVPTPDTVARFVRDSLAHPGSRRLVALPPPVDRLGLAERMERCVTSR